MLLPLKIYCVNSLSHMEWCGQWPAINETVLNGLILSLALLCVSSRSFLRGQQQHEASVICANLTTIYLHYLYLSSILAAITKERHLIYQ